MRWFLARHRWLPPVIWAGGSRRSGVWDQPGQYGETVSTKVQIVGVLACACVPASEDWQENHPEPGRQRFTTHFTLHHVTEVRLCLKKRKQKHFEDYTMSKCRKFLTNHLVNDKTRYRKECSRKPQGQTISPQLSIFSSVRWWLP